MTEEASPSVVGDLRERIARLIDGASEPTTFNMGGLVGEPMMRAYAARWNIALDKADAILALLPLPSQGLPGRYQLGELIYRAMYEHQGGKWEANETPDVWFEAADRLRAMLSAAPPLSGGSK
jgi:hypothetical protein